MEWVKTVHWIALFIAFLGPLVATGLSFEWLTSLMLFLGIVIALATYNAGINQNAVIYLLLAGLAFVLMPTLTVSQPLAQYLKAVVTLGAWYILPIALAQGWKSLIG